MREVELVIATGAVDLQGEQIVPEALEELARSLSRAYLPMAWQHDPEHPPIGRLKAVWLAHDARGLPVLKGAAEVWEPGDTPAKLEGDGRRVLTRAERRRAVLAGATYRDSPDGSAFADEIALLLKGRREYYFQKAAAPPSILILELGILALGAIAAGFLQELGKDAYQALKRRVVDWYAHHAAAQEALQFHFGVETHSRIVDVVCIIPTPTQLDVQSFFESGIKSLDPIVHEVVRANHRAVRVVLQWNRASWRMHYWLRDDGVPSPIQPVPVDQLERMGVSISGTAVLKPARDPDGP